MSESPRPTQWIVSPLVDLSFITLGWIAFYLTPHLFPQHLETIRLVSVTFLSGAHRYYTFPLVYFDRAEFGRRRGFYILAPVLVTVGVALCYYFRVDEPEMYGAWYLFNYFHFVRQKYGILRIYSGKSGYGHKPLDAWSTYAWGIGGFFYLLSYTTPTEGRFTYYLSQFFGGIPTFPIVVWTIYAAAAVLTLAWLVHESVVRVERVPIEPARERHAPRERRGFPEVWKLRDRQAARVLRHVRSRNAPHTSRHSPGTLASVTR